MDSYKSPRFWLALAGLVAVSVLAGFKIFSSELAAGLLVGLLSGVGVSTPTASLKQAAPLAGVALAGIGGALLLGGCVPGGPDAVIASAAISVLVVLAALAAVVRLAGRAKLAAARAANLKTRLELSKKIAAKLRERAYGPVLAAFMLALSPGCAGFQLKDEATKAMPSACALHSAASAVAIAVCRFLPEGDKRDQCLKYTRLSSDYGSAALGVAGAHLGAACPAD